ncbi:TnsA endonuclease N-terminal domain-containing protein [Modicisalibacter muralis]|nr:TnsA endonuclease N-terminal domain-containing protein [Halomonas muralis]
MNRVLTVESSLEFDVCFHFEYTSSISSYEAQPEGFYYSFQGKQRPYTPDFLVIDKVYGSKFIEIKFYSELEDEEFREKFRCRQKSALDHGLPLLLVTDEKIRITPVLSNLKLLHRYSGLKSLTPLHLTMLDIVRKSGKVRVRDLAQETGQPSSLVLSSVISWLAVGEINSDLSAAKLGVDSIVWC